MLIKTRELLGYKLGARDGEIGRLKDFYFEDQTWTVRYLVADTGGWLPHRKVLISPFAVTGLHPPPRKVVDVNLSKQQIEQSPPIETHQPVSRHFEKQYLQYYGWPDYWPGPLLWGPLDFPGPYLPAGEEARPAAPPAEESEDSHLRSVAEVAGFQGYLVQGLDRAFGHIEEFIIDDRTWSVRYLVADTRNWWPGKRVLLAPQWIAWVSWPEARVYVDLDRHTIQRAPAYEHSTELTREYEQQLFDYFNRTPYWETEAKTAAGSKVGRD